MQERSEATAVQERLNGDAAGLSDRGLPDDAVRAVFDAAPDGIVMADEAGQILMANRQVEQLFGYGRGDLLGRSVDDLLPESLRQVHRAHRTRYRVEPRTRTMGAGLHLLGRRSDGSEFPVEISLSPIKTDDGLRVVAAITRHHRTDESGGGGARGTRHPGCDTRWRVHLRCRHAVLHLRQPGRMRPGRVQQR